MKSGLRHVSVGRAGQSVSMPLQRAPNMQKAGRRGSVESGFTLIEIIVVVALISVLASVAVPRYQNYMMEARRADGQLLLRQNALVLERCLTFTGAYSNCSLLMDSEDNYYQLQETRTATTYNLVAVPASNASQSGDQHCLNLTLNHLGDSGATGSKPDTCW